MYKQMLGEKIYQLRKRRGLTQQELADLVGVSNKAVSKWETDEANPDIGIVAKLAEVLGVPIGELFSEEKGQIENSDAANTQQKPVETRSKNNFGVLALFAGSIGVHNFKLGFKKKAAFQVALFALGIVLFIIGMSFYFGVRPAIEREREAFPTHEEWFIAEFDLPEELLNENFWDWPYEINQAFHDSSADYHAAKDAMVEHLWAIEDAGWWILIVAFYIPLAAVAIWSLVEALLLFCGIIKKDAQGKPLV